MIANESLQTYLTQKMAEFYYIPKKNSQPIKPKIKLNWTDDKSNLVELLYAIQENRSINDGKLDIKVLIESFEEVFDIKLKGYYHMFTRVKSRKRIQTKFLDKLKESLLNRIRMDNNKL